MPEPGGSTSQSGFFYQNSLAAMYLAEMIGKPGAREAECISEVTNEASGTKVEVDDILVRFVNHKRYFVQAKENINTSGEAWEKLWHHIRCQLLADFDNEKDRIILFIGNENEDSKVLYEICMRAKQKQRSDQWQLTNSKQVKLYTDIKKVIEDDLVVSILSSIDVIIQTKDKTKDDLLKGMPKCNVGPAILARLLRDCANENSKVLYELYMHVKQKQRSDQSQLTNSKQVEFYTDTKKVIEDDLKIVEKTELDDLVVSILSNIDVIIQTRDETCDKLLKGMPKCNVEPAILARLLRDFAAEAAIYNLPWESQKLQRTLNDEYGIVIKDIEAFKEFEPWTILIDDDKDFVMGDDNYIKESPRHTVRLGGYRISTNPVTNLEFLEYIKSISSFKKSDLSGWKDKIINKYPFPDDQANKPVTGVTFFEACDYCKWLSGVTHRNYRLPTEAEWEKAARGNDGRKYPWGDEWDEERKDQNESPFQCWNMVGAVAEWTCSLWGQDWQKPDPEFKYDYKDKWKPDDNRNKVDAPNIIRRVIRGGLYENDPNEVRCCKRKNDLPESRGHKSPYGFRIVLDS